MPTSRSPHVLVLAFCAVAVLWLAPAASGAMKVRIAKPVARVTIPSSTAVGNVFAESQRVSTVCRSGELALAPGILDAPRHIVGQSFGPSAVGAYATGAKGPATLKLQLLCAKGANITHKRVEGKTRPSGAAGGAGTFTTTATANCGRKRYAIGAPLSQEFSPGMGRFASKPSGASRWQVTVEGIPSSFPFDTAVPAYADVACVPKRALKSVATIDASTSGLVAAASAEVKLTCTSGRRPVGWGVDLRPFTRSTFSPSSDGWVLPVVRKAAFDGSSMTFAFDLPPGARTGGENGLGAADVTQTAYVVCGKLAG